MDNITDLWQQALSEIEKKLSKPSFETWLKSTSANRMEGDTIIITAPNEFARDWLESRYSSLITETLLELTGSELKAKFIIPQNQSDADLDLRTIYEEETKS